MNIETKINNLNNKPSQGIAILLYRGMIQHTNKNKYKFTWFENYFLITFFIIINTS